MTTDRFRETAIRHARIIEDQKRVKAQVADLVLECFDLPSQQGTSPSDPMPKDLKTFTAALSLFQPNDFDELVSERNIDDRCGYALCPNPNQKARHNGLKVWNGKGGGGFKLVDRAELERWCSKECRHRGEFARAQLSTEAAWVRDVTETKVTLLDDMQRNDDIVAAIKDLSIAEPAKDELEAKLKELSLERGDEGKPVTTSIDIVEKDRDDAVAEPPSALVANGVEGHEVRQVRFG
jgi:RNA polymerase II-associated protein 2